MQAAAEIFQWGAPVPSQNIISMQGLATSKIIARGLMRSAGIIPISLGVYVAYRRIYSIAAGDEILKSILPGLVPRIAHFFVGAALVGYLCWMGYSLISRLSRKSIAHFSLIVGWFTFRQFGIVAYGVRKAAGAASVSTMELIVLLALGLLLGFATARYFYISVSKFTLEANELS